MTTADHDNRHMTRHVGLGEAERNELDAAFSPYFRAASVQGRYVIAIIERILSARATPDELRERVEGVAQTLRTEAKQSGAPLNYRAALLNCADRLHDALAGRTAEPCLETGEPVHGMTCTIQDGRHIHWPLPQPTDSRRP